jgi:hypothetical protein
MSDPDQGPSIKITLVGVSTVSLNLELYYHLYA